MPKTKQERQQTTMKCIARNSLRLALSHLEQNDFSAAAYAASTAAEQLRRLAIAGHLTDASLIKVAIENGSITGQATDAQAET